MNKGRIAVLIFMSLYFLLGCNSDNKEAAKILAEAETIVHDHPDSVLQMLDPVLKIGKISQKQYYTYILLQTRAKDNSFKDISSDSLIFKARDYFKSNNDMPELALSLFFCGRVLHSKKEYKEALNQYLEALKFANKTQNENELEGLIHTNIGYVYYIQLLPDEAMAHYKDAEKHFAETGNVKNKAAINNYIGNTFLRKKENDSAMFYYNKGMDIAKQSGDIAAQTMILQNMGKAYSENKQYDSAKKYFTEALKLTQKDNLKRAKILLSLSNIMENEEKPDSVLIYLNEANALSQSSNDNYFKISLYSALSIAYEKRNDYQMAYQYNKELTKSLDDVMTENEEKSILAFEKMYNYEVLQNESKGLEIQRQYLIIGILLVVIAAVIVSSYFYRNARTRRKHLEEAELKIDNFQNMVNTYKNMENEYKNIENTFKGKEDTFRGKLLEHFQILKKSALLEGFLNDEEKSKNKKLLKKFNEIVYNQDTMDWNKLYESMNDVHYNFLENLRNEYPQLDEIEFRICCMIYSAFSNEEISIIMGMASNSVSKKRSSIRRKLDIEEYGNIAEFLHKKAPGAPGN